MKIEDEIQERIDELESRSDNYVSGAPQWSHFRGKIDALEWVLRDE